MAAPVASLPAPVLTASGATAARPPSPSRRPGLMHFDGGTFSFRTVGQNATGPSGVTFKTGSGSTGPDGSKASQVAVEAFDQNGLGTFTRR